MYLFQWLTSKRLFEGIRNLQCGMLKITLLYCILYYEVTPLPYGLAAVTLACNQWRAVHLVRIFPGKSTGVGCHCLLWRKASEGQTALCFSVGLGSIPAWGFCKEHILEDSDSDLTCRLSPPRAVSVVVLMSRDPARVWLRWSSRRHWLGWPGLAPVFPHMSPRLLGGPGDGPGGCRPFPVDGVTMTTQEALEAGSLLILSLDPSRAAPQSFLWREIGSFLKCILLLPFSHSQGC